MSLFKEIFDRHFFSNHHAEAIELEEKFENYFSGFECITFSSLAGLIVAVIDELVDSSIRLYVPKDLPDYLAVDRVKINKFLSITGRSIIEELPLKEQSKVNKELEQYKVDVNSYSAVLLDKQEIIAILFDLKKYHYLLCSGGLFVTKNIKIAEKIRWSRSSYGRRQHEFVNIAANGRFSEFQAALVKSGFKGL